MARLRRLAALLGAAVAAAAADGRAHEKRLQLDMGPLDAHLARVDGCLRGLPERPGAKREDCVAFADAALQRCDAAFGGELDACMARAERAAQPQPKEEGELLPELRKFRQDVIHCYDKEGIRPRSVQALASPLKRCGIVQLHGVLPKVVMSDAEEHMRKFLAHRESFHMFHPGVKDEDDLLGAGKPDVHDLPVNLDGGRFELVPPAEGSILSVVQWLTSHFNTPSHVTEIWGHDHRDQAQLAYLVIRAQHNDTALVVDQPWHQDRDTTEDVRMQIAVHEWKPSAGPLEVLPASHRLHGRLRPPDDSYPRGRLIDRAGRGDVLFHFPRLRHRGTRRTGRKPRATLDLVLHSVGRGYHEESERDPEHVAARFLAGSPAQEALQKFKELWSKKADHNRENPEL